MLAVFKKRRMFFGFFCCFLGLLCGCQKDIAIPDAVVQAVVRFSDQDTFDYTYSQTTSSPSEGIKSTSRQVVVQQSPLLYYENATTNSETESAFVMERLLSENEAYARVNGSNMWDKIDTFFVAYSDLAKLDKLFSDKNNYTNVQINDEELTCSLNQSYLANLNGSDAQYYKALVEQGVLPSADTMLSAIESREFIDGTIMIAMIDDAPSCITLSMQYRELPLVQTNNSVSVGQTKETRTMTEEWELNAFSQEERVAFLEAMP